MDQTGQVGLIESRAVDCAGGLRPPRGAKLARWLDVQRGLAKFLLFAETPFAKFLQNPNVVTYTKSADQGALINPRVP